MPLTFKKFEFEILAIYDLPPYSSLQSKMLLVCFAFTFFFHACNMESEKIIETQFVQLNKTKIIFLNSSDGFDYLKDSPFIEGLSLMDISVRMNHDFTNSNLDTARGAHLKFLENEVLNWTKPEIDRLMKFIELVIPDIQSETPQILQDSLFFIKTSGQEEFNAFYTCKKAIVFPKSWLSKNNQNKHNSFFTRVLYHELFHIFTRNNFKKHQKLYEIVGFHPQKYAIPEPLKKRLITNPDFADLDFLIDLETKNGENIRATILTYNKLKTFDSSAKFSDIIGFGLFPVELYEGNWKVAQWNGKLQPIPIETFKDFYPQVGQFTDYYLGPEEILADGYSMKMVDKHFENLKNSPPEDLAILDKLMKLLK